MREGGKGRDDIMSVRRRWGEADDGQRPGEETGGC